LGIGPGDNVLVPSFICSVVSFPFNALGIKMRFYEVDKSLEPKFETASVSVNSRTKAFLGVHYFGFPQEIEAVRSFCESHKIYYIEDNAHGFLSTDKRGPLGAFGDIAIFSQRKTLALPNGGALVVNTSSLPNSISDTTSDSPHRRVSIPRFMLQNIVANLDVFPSIRGLDVSSYVKNFAESGQSEDLQVSSEAHSGFASWILLRTDFDRERRLRRQTYMFWKDLFAQKKRDFSLFFEDLPKGVVPWVFPIRVHSKRGEGLIQDLAKQGIECFRWPDPPLSAPRTRLGQETVLIPLNRHPLMPYRYVNVKMPNLCDYQAESKCART
jgi:perosamine synthetase